MAGDAFWDLSHFVNGDMKGLVAKVNIKKYEY